MGERITVKSNFNLPPGVTARDVEGFDPHGRQREIEREERNESNDWEICALCSGEGEAKDGTTCPRCRGTGVL